MLAWFQDFISRLSLARMAFFALMFAQVACFTPVYFLIYRQYSETLEKKYALLNRQSEKDIRIQADLYQDILSYISPNQITPRTKEIFEVFKRSLKGSKDSIDRTLQKLKAQYSVEFILISKSDFEIVATTRSDYLGKRFSQWPHMIEFITHLESNKIVSRTSWSLSSHKLKQFYFLKPDHLDYILEISGSLPDRLNLNVVVNYLANITYHNPSIKNIYFYDSKYFRLHNSRHKPSKRQVEILDKLMHSEAGIIDYKSTRAKTHHKFIRLPKRPNNPLFRNIVAFEIQYDQGRIENEKKYLQGYFFVLLMLLLVVAYILSRFLSSTFTKPMTQMVVQIKNLSSGTLDQKVSAINQREFATLVDSVNWLAFELKTNITKAQKLSRKIINTQDNERQRIAQDLHDSIGQSLTAIKMKLSLSSSNDDQFFKESKELIDYCSSELRNIYNSMYPSILRDLGIKDAILWYEKVFFAESIKTKIKIDLNCDLSESQSRHIFRIVQESFANIKKHSQAQSVEVELHHDAQNIYLKIRDDGVGISKDKKNQFLQGLGVQSMQLRTDELGGEFDLQTASGGGTELSLTIPQKR